MRARHHHPRLCRGHTTRAERELREDDPAEPAVHQELPRAQERSARSRQLDPRRRREHRGRHLRQAVPRGAEADQRRDLPHARGGSRMGQVAVDAGDPLDRGDRGRLPGRPRHAGPLRRITPRHRATAREYRALAVGRKSHRKRPEVEHDLRAARRPRSAHRHAARLPRVLAAAGGQRPREVRAIEEPREQRTWHGDRPGQGAHHRLRQADRRADRRSRAGDGVLRRRGAHRGRHHLRVHALHPQHAARDRMLVDSRHLAARPRVGVRLRARSVLDPRAVPGVRDRRVARRAEDERHHAGHRPRHAQADRRALHLPAPLPCRHNGAGGRRGRLRGADGDRHSGDPGSRRHRERGRGGADLHQPDPAAGAAVVYGCQRVGGAAQSH